VVAQHRPPGRPLRRRRRRGAACDHGDGGIAMALAPDP
jgi:hypothetical protein